MVAHTFSLKSRAQASSIFIIALSMSFLSADASESSFSGRVVRILDGDTIEVMHDQNPVKVRLKDIDCPERRQAFGTRSKQRTAELCFEKVVSIVTSGHDRYQRLIGDVFLPDGRSLSQELVRGGYAWWYRRYAPKNVALQLLEQDARSNHRGL